MEDDVESATGEAPPEHGVTGRGLYRLDSNQSSTSVFEDVEMAHDEVRYLGAGRPTPGGPD